MTIDFWGDISLAMNQQAFKDIVDIINAELDISDYSIANLESPIVYDINYPPIIKDGPNLYTTQESVDFYKNLKIDCYTLANNHLGDYGVPGIKDTIEVLEKMNKEYTGTSMEICNTYLPLRKEMNGIKFSVFSFCENEFGIVKDNRHGAAGYNPAVVKELLKKEKRVSDYIFVVFHGGTEHYPFPTPKQKERYHLLVDWGADYVFGMHSHCPQGYEQYKDSYIFYGLGNFFFPIKEPTLNEGWSLGYGVRLYANKNEIKHEIIPYYFEQEGNAFKYTKDVRFYDYLREISSYIEDDFVLQKLYDSWCKIRGEKVFLFVKKLIGMQDEVAKAQLKNLLVCEAHNELLSNYARMLLVDNAQECEKYMNVILQYRKIFTYLEMDEVDDNVYDEVDILWGLSAKAKLYINKYKKENRTIIIVDKNMQIQGMHWGKIRILEPKQAAQIYPNAVWYICTREIFHEEIEQELLDMGISKARIKQIKDI